MCPMYEYRCDNCGFEFPFFLKMKDRNLPLEEACCECGEKSLHRIYSFSGTMDSELLKADRRMEESGVQKRLEEIRDYCNPDMEWKG